MFKNIYLSIIILIAIPAMALGETFIVDTEQDAVDAQPGDGICATETNFCTLRAAIQESNSLQGPDIIEIPAGRFRPSVGTIEEDAGASGDFDILDEVEIIGAGRQLTVLDGGLGPFRLFDVQSSNDVVVGPVVKISKLRLSNGLGGVTARGAVVRNEGDLTLMDVEVVEANESGNAILNSRGKLTISDSVFQRNCQVISNQRGIVRIVDSEFTENYCAGSGSVIESFSSNEKHGLLQIDGSLFKSNGNSSTINGGAIYSVGTPLHIYSSVFQNNMTKGDGGAIWHSGSFAITNSTFDGNLALLNGGGVNLGSYNSGNFGLIENTVFSNNSVGRRGGGILQSSETMSFRWYKVDLLNNGYDSGLTNGFGAYGGGASVLGQDVIIDQARILGNNSNIAGGGISTNGGVEIKNSVIHKNTSGSGGGISVVGAYLGNLLVRNSTISGNNAEGISGVGGGISSYGNTKVVLSHVTLVDNTSGYMGANLHGYRLIDNIANSVVKAPVGEENCGSTQHTEIASSGYNVYSDESCKSVGNQDVQGVDARVSPFDDSSAVHQLSTDSPAYGIIPIELCSPVDQRNYYRRNSSTCSPGAYEHDADPINAGFISFNASEYRVGESSQIIRIPVTRSGGKQGAVQAIIFDNRNGSAIPPLDYQLKEELPDSLVRGFDITKELSWQDGEGGEKYIDLEIHDNLHSIGDVTVELDLRLLRGGVKIGAISVATVTIKDDEQSSEETLADGLPEGETTDTSENVNSESESSALTEAGSNGGGALALPFLLSLMLIYRAESYNKKTIPWRVQA